jgi:prepilin-type processing-associated H-X9-DG protein
MPLAYSDPAIVGLGPATYWWGASRPDGVDHTAGFVWPYLQADLQAASVYECPAQPWGTYTPQGATQESVTSTYGYNGYFLSPPHTPGWSYQIGHRPWQNLDQLRHAARLFVFGDAMLAWQGGLRNNALLDPPWLYQRGRWTRNSSPTTRFRHRDRAQMVHADGHVAAHDPGDYLPLPKAGPLRVLWREHRVGAVGRHNGPHYVPDWRDW